MNLKIYGKKLKSSLKGVKMSSTLPKTIFITGATSGFGKATAKLFNDNGWQTILQVEEVID